MVSKMPRKQRLALYQAPLHLRHKHLAAPLSPELKQRFGFRSLPVRKGDKVRIVKGDFKGLEGDVVEVDTKRYKIKVAGALTVKADGTEVLRPISPSNVVILKLKPDKKRDKVIKRKSKRGVEKIGEEGSVEAS